MFITEILSVVTKLTVYVQVVWDHSYRGKISYRKKWVSPTADVMETEFNSLEGRLKGHPFEATGERGNGQTRSRGL